MQIVPVTKNALVFDANDWARLGVLKTDFDEMCNSQLCKTCPLGDFCLEHENPGDYLGHLYEFLGS